MRVHIVGRGDGWDKAPSTKSDGDLIIGLNTVIIHRDVDIAFDIHNDLDGNNHKRTTSLEDIERICQRVRDTGVTFITCKQWDHVPCYPYPLQEIIDYFNTDFFGGGVDYITAWVLYQGYKEIHYWGFNYLGKADYIRQLPSACYWVGRMEQMGIRPVIHGQPSYFMRTVTKKLYGYGIKQSRSWVSDTPEIYEDPKPKKKMTVIKIRDLKTPGGICVLCNKREPTKMIENEGFQAYFYSCEECLEKAKDKMLNFRLIESGE